MAPIGIAVIGAGYWGKIVAQEILALSRAGRNVQLRAVVDNSPTVLEQCRQKFGPLDYRLNYQNLASDKDISAAHICTPNATHFEVASAFLRKGKHVIVEKPLALRSREAFGLVRLARENGAILCTGHVHRFNNGVKALREAVASGLLGDIYYVRFRWTGYLPPQKERDVITDLAPHPFDICNNILGQWPSKVTCRGKGFRTPGNEETAFITAEHPGGTIANIEVSWLDCEKRREVTVVGSNGVAHLECQDQKVFVNVREEIRQIPVIPSNMLASEIAHFLDCIEHNVSKEPFPNLSDGLLGSRVVAVLEAARMSVSHERIESVPLPISEGIFAR